MDKCIKMKVADIDKALKGVLIGHAYGIRLLYDHGGAHPGFWLIDQNKMESHQLSRNKKKACTAFNKATKQALANERQN